MLRKLTLALAVLPALIACPGPDPVPDGGVTDSGTAAEPPQISSVSPNEGSTDGDTPVLVTGNHFETGARVFFGDTEVTATDVVVSSARRISLRTPARSTEGAVSVRVVNPDGQEATLANAYTYVADQVPTGIAEAIQVGPAMLTDSTGRDPVIYTVRADVEVAGVTGGAGQGDGVRAQVGYALEADTETLADLIWSDAQYEGDADGSAAQDKARDRYAGELSVPGAGGQPSRTYVVALRFSTDDGATWEVADVDGASNGTSVAGLQRLTVTPNKVDWCKLGGQSVEPPPTVALKAGQTGPMIFAQIYEAGVTPGAGAGAQITVELGYGAHASDPSAGGWTWAPASYNVDHGNNDEYQAQLPSVAEGAWAFTFRARVAGGPWRYCDANGAADDAPFELSQLGTLNVGTTSVERCKVQFPATLETVEGLPSDKVYGWVWSQGITDAAGAGAGITGELGYGPQGTDPTDAAWSWTQATWNADKDSGAADEYQATLTGPAPGTWHYAYRFSVGGGAKVYCDLDGSDNGFTSAQAGVLTAKAAATTCRLDSVVQPGTTTAVSSIGSGEPVEAKARLLIPNLTGQTGAAPNVLAQVGVGTAGSDASASPAWGWKDATFLSDDGTTNEDVYSVVFTPAYSGTRAVSFRFSTNGGQSWLYCDLDGSEIGGYTPSQQASLNVGKHGSLNYCNLQHPETACQSASMDGGTAGACPDAGVPSSTPTVIFGQVFEAGVTPHADAAAAAAAYVVEWGYGKKVEDPGLAWTWSPATFNVAAGNNDEFRGVLSGLPVGTWSYAFRYRKMASQRWCYGDLDGNGLNTGLTGFNGENASGGENLGQATVTP